MIAGFSKAVALYLAPLLSLTSLILSLLAFLAPSLVLRSQIALLMVTPSASLREPSSNQSVVEGPTVLMGALGSCSKSNNAAPLNCTAPSLSPVFNFAVLPSSAPEMLSAPTSTTPAFIAVSLGFSILFFVIFTLLAFRPKMGAKLGAMLDRPFLHRASAWLGLLGFMIGLTSYLVIRMWFGKAAEDFNQSIVDETQDAPQLIATVGNGFTMIWVAYAFYAVPLICTLSKLHVTAPGEKAIA